MEELREAAIVEEEQQDAWELLQQAKQRLSIMRTPVVTGWATTAAATPVAAAATAVAATAAAVAVAATAATESTTAASAVT